MSRFNSLLLAVLFAAFLGFLLMGGCGDLPEESSSSGQTLSSISISPAIATLEVGGTQSFTALAVYSDSTSASIKPTWSVSGEIGTITAVGYTGLFTATAEGTGSVTAAYSSKTASAAITVTGTGEGEGEGGVLATIEVSPSTANKRVTEKQTFTASGFDVSGESITISPSWEISGEAIGIFTFSGTMATLETTAEGYAIISCISGEVVGYAYVTIEGFVAEITVESDTYVDEANPANAYGSETSLKAGYVSASDKRFEAYFKFSLDSIPSGVSIESATFKIYPTSAGSSSLQLKKLTSSFSDTTTWESRPSIGSFILSKTFSTGSYNSLTDNLLKELVQSWKDGTATNEGLALLQEGTDNGTVVILSKENNSNPPVLRLEYTTP